MTTSELYRPGRCAAPQHRRWMPALTPVGLACVLLVTPFAGAASACTDRGAKSPEASCKSLAFDGGERTYRIYVPARLAPLAPLLVVLHGGGGGGAGMEALTGRGFNRRADAAGALIVYPDGIDHGWNDGRRDLQARAAREEVDDVGFLRALVASLALKCPTNRSACE